MAIHVNKHYREDMAELAAYRATGLTPEQVQAMVDPAPLPLPFYEEDAFSVAAGILVDDEVIVTTYASLDNEKWEK